MKFDLPTSTILESIEIGDDLTYITFKSKAEQVAVDLVDFIRPPMPEVGCISHSTGEYTIWGMDHLALMSSLSRQQIQTQLVDNGEKHTIEYILARAQSANLIQDLYPQILSFVKNRGDTLRAEYATKKEQFLHLQITAAKKMQFSLQFDFKSLQAYMDVREFAGRMVAFQTPEESCCRSQSIVSPITKEIQFGFISPESLERNDNRGYPLNCFYERNSVPPRRKLLTSSYLQKNPLKMRLATLEELDFLSAACDLVQGHFESHKKESKALLLAEIQKYHHVVPPSSITPQYLSLKRKLSESEEDSNVPKALNFKEAEVKQYNTHTLNASL